MKEEGKRAKNASVRLLQRPTLARSLRRRQAPYLKRVHLNLASPNQLAKKIPLLRGRQKASLTNARRRKKWARFTFINSKGKGRELQSCLVVQRPKWFHVTNLHSYVKNTNDGILSNYAYAFLMIDERSQVLLKVIASREFAIIDKWS